MYVLLGAGSAGIWAAGIADIDVVDVTDVAVPLVVTGFPMVLVLLLVYAGTGSFAGTGDFKLLNRNTISVVLFDVQ